MANGITSIEVRKQRGKVQVLGMAQTPKGQKYIRDRVELEVKDSRDPKFKSEMAAAITQMYDPKD